MLRSAFLSCACLLLPALPALAQTASVTGRVTDTTGAIIAGATVGIVNQGTAAERTATTNDSGYFTFSLLAPGRYQMRVETQGFKTINRSGIILETDQRAELNFTMEIGAVTEQIEVTANVAQLNTVEASRGQVIENRRIVEMPLNGRNYNQLALLSAGAVQPLAGARMEGFSVNGMRVTQNNFQLDGVDNNGIELAGAQRRSEMVQPSIDAIQEFKVQTNSYAAEYGRAMGAVVNVTTKSGTNDIHGTAFEFLRNEKLDAKNFFDNPNTPKPPFKRNQYGLTLGGPIFIPKIVDGRNRFFFFGDFESTRIRESTTTTSTIPTAGMRSGDFSDLLSQRNRTITDPAARAPFPGNLIPASRFDRVGKTLIDLYPAPQNPNVANNFLYNAPRIQDVDRWDVRIDANVTTNDNVFWRLSKQDLSSPVSLALPPPAYGGGAFDFITEGYNTGATWNHIWTPNLIQSIRGAWNFALFKRDNPTQTNGEFLNQKYGIPGGNSSIPGGFTQMGLTGYRALGIGAFNPVDRDSQNRQLVGDLTWTHGRHTIKTGANIIRSQNNIYNIRTEVGAYTFNARFTTDGAADFLLGMASAYAWNTPLQVDLRMWNLGFYLQDDYKLTPNLTLNLGLRYEVVLPFIDKRDRMGIFDTYTDPANPKLIFAGANGTDRYNRAMFHTDKNNWMPRIGFAYKLHNRTALRGGFGMFYTYMEPFGDAEYLIGNPPNAFGVNLASSATTPAVLLRNGPAPGALTLERAVGLQFVSYERRADLGYAMQWNWNIQHEFARDWLFETGYSGSRGVHLLMRFEDNFAPPGPGNINANRRYQRAEIPGTNIVSSPLGPVQGYKNNANSSYHALITRLEKRFSQGFTLLTSYGWSKTIGDTCGNAASGNTTGCGYQDTRYLNLERAVDNQDVPHRFVLSGIYELPFGRGKALGGNAHPAANAVFGGWSIGSIVTWASGRPYSLTVSGNPANTGTIGIVNRPNVVGDPNSGERTLQSDFNTAAFVPNAQYTTGNLGRNTMRQRSFFGWDFSAMKNFRLHERATLQFRFEAFQFTNTPRFGQAGNALGTANFGTITGADTPRNLQFGLKLIW
ncbi:MAG: TonB-dependent receptor [Bryobacterales bacterium]|nr:TonB-dependent receptor [Bryobacterales bacterium]